MGLDGMSREPGSGRTRVEGLGSCSGRSCRPPILKRFASESAERIAGNEMALDVERVLDCGMNGPEPLRRSGRLEPPHLPLTSTNRRGPGRAVCLAAGRQVRILGPIVSPPALLMASCQSQFRLRCGIRTQPISHQHVRREAVLFGVACASVSRLQSCRVAVAPADREPRLRRRPLARARKSPAGDQNSRRIEMPTRGRSMTSAAKLFGEQRAELQHPSSDRFQPTSSKSRQLQAPAALPCSAPGSAS